jgi:ribosome maturation factor RimP
MSNKMTLAALQAIIAPSIMALGYELWGCELHSRGYRSLLRIYIDSAQGVTVADCTRASRQINALLNVEQGAGGNYELEVSSPGLDRPLFTPAQYQRFIGQPVQLRLHVPQEGRRHYAGVLQAVEAGQITLAIEGTIVVLSLENVEKANLALNG